MREKKIKIPGPPGRRQKEFAPHRPRVIKGIITPACISFFSYDDGVVVDGNVEVGDVGLEDDFSGLNNLFFRDDTRDKFFAFDGAYFGVSGHVWFKGETFFMGIELNGFMDLLGRGYYVFGDAFEEVRELLIKDVVGYKACFGPCVEMGFDE